MSNIICNDLWDENKVKVKVKCTIVVNIALDNYATLVDLMGSMASYIRQKIKIQKNPKS